MSGADQSWQSRYVERFYSRPERGWRDGTTEFHDLCRSAIRPGGRLLEIGAGPTNPTSQFLATLGELYGVDLDSAVRDNAALVSAEVSTGSSLPYPNDHFDACVSNYVLEHIPDPQGHISEVARVLRHGGVYVFRTPNQMHYVSLIARATPHWFHELVANRARNLASDAHEPYPTFYALNSRKNIHHCAARAGLEVAELRMVEKEPSYGMAARGAFLLFMAYERVVNAIELLADARANIFGVLRKP